MLVISISWLQLSVSPKYWRWLMKNKPKMAYSRDLPKMADSSVALWIDWWSWLAWMEGGEGHDWHGWLAWMTGMDDWHGWLAQMTGTDDWHRWLAWMTGNDDWHGWLAWMTGMDDQHGWLAWMTGLDRLSWTNIDYPRLYWWLTDWQTDRRTDIASC